MRWLRHLWRRLVHSRLHGRRRLAEFGEKLARKQQSLDRYYFDYVSGEKRGPTMMHRAHHAVFSTRLGRTRRRYAKLLPPPKKGKK